jgi:PAS domain S-box-containing protein
MIPLSPQSQLEDLEALALLETLESLHPLTLAIDDTMRVLWMSQACQALCGNAGEYSGKSIPAFFGALSDKSSPEFFDRQMSQITHRFKKQKGSTEASLDLGTRDGAPYRLNIKFLRIPSLGKPPLSLCILASADSLTNSAPEKSKGDGDSLAVLDLFPEAAFTLDPHGSFLRVNKAASALFQIEEAKFRGPAAKLLRPYSEEMAEWVDDLPKTGEVREQEFHITQPDGSMAWVSLSTRRLEAGEGADHLVWIQNVGAHVLRARQLELENSRLNSFVHSVTHDLRSPLASILGFTQLLRRDYDQILSDTGRQFTHRIEQNARRMESLIENLFDLARIDFESGHRTLIDCDSILQDLKKELTYRLSEQDVELQIPDTSSPVFSSRSYLHQIFSNLVINSLEHMGDCSNRRIEVTIDNEPSHQTISVRDYGQGLAVGSSKKVFEPFYSRFSAADNKGPRGLGLTIVKNVAEAHGGRTWAESDLEHGCCIRVMLPSR